MIVRIDSPGGDAVASGDHLARDEPAQQEEADGDLDVGRRGFGRLLYGDDGRPDCRVSGHYTGSIGVVFGKPNIRGLFDKLGIERRFAVARASSPISIPNSTR